MNYSAQVNATVALEQVNAFAGHLTHAAGEPIEEYPVEHTNAEALVQDA